MYSKRSIILFCVYTLANSLLAYKGHAQDLHFSQFSHASVLLSPTETGNYNGDWRFINNYRNQWGQIGKPLSTIAVAFDQQIYIFNQKISLGGQFVHDESGNYLLIHQKFMLSAAYHQTIGHQTFRFGIQGGMVQKRLNSRNFSFPDQWDQWSGFFNNSLPTNEQAFGQRIFYPDFNVGASYGRKIWKLKPEFTFALFHINRPNESFFYEENKLNIRKALYIKAPINLKNKWSMDPQFLYMWQNKSIDFIIGSNLNYGLAENFFRAKQAFFGVSLRNSLTRNWDAFIFTGGLQFKNLRTAVSYDITVSQLRLANSYSGAIEFALIYTGISSVLNQRTIPCNRL